MYINTKNTALVNRLWLLFFLFNVLLSGESLYLCPDFSWDGVDFLHSSCCVLDLVSEEC